MRIYILLEFDDENNYMCALGAYFSLTELEKEKKLREKKSNKLCLGYKYKCEITEIKDIE